jgi:hypothetical protein
MNNSSKYPRLQELASNIQTQMERLKAGELSLEELELVTEQGRELYERLVVLRYKAYNETVTGRQDIEVVQESNELITEGEAPKQDAPHQVSLIDAIEEVTKEELFDEAPLFALNTKEESPVSNTLFDLAALPATQSVNDMLAQTIVQHETLAQHHTNTPIADLKIAITLNQRFQFSRELFKGNNQDYEVAIDLLNTSSKEDALQYVKSLESKYEWSNESSVARDFRTLVERRHS